LNLVAIHTRGSHFDCLNAGLAISCYEEKQHKKGKAFHVYLVFLFAGVPSVLKLVGVRL
jgi:hypothetical protein